MPGKLKAKDGLRFKFGVSEQRFFGYIHQKQNPGLSFHNFILFLGWDSNLNLFLSLGWLSDLKAQKPCQ